MMPEAVHYALAKRMDVLHNEIHWEEVREQDHQRQLTEAQTKRAALESEVAEIAAFLAQQDTAASVDMPPLITRMFGGTLP
jgi:hypothetical protein